MKTCTKCGCTKPLSDFHKQPNSPDGIKSICKLCCAIRAREYRIRTADKAKAYRAANKQRQSDANKRWREVVPGRNAQKCAEYYAKHKATWPSKVAVRKASKLQATPQWVDTALIKFLYATRRYMTEATGFTWHVDHLVPLQNSLVCGLHVHFNLRVVPQEFNLHKGNRYDTDKAVR